MRGEVVTAASLRRKQAALDDVKAVLKRMDVMKSQNKSLADRCFQARMNIEASGRK